MDIGVALLDVPLDWAGLAPKKLRARRQTVVVKTVRCRAEQGRVRTGAVGPIYAGTYRRSITNIDLNNLIDHPRLTSIG
jgi:hypothetical protein